METHSEANEILELDEGSWVYLSLGDCDRGDDELSERVIEACESNGWLAVTSSPSQHEIRSSDSARFFEGMSHAVEHADVVIVSVNGPSALADAELAFAYRYKKPLIVIRIQQRETVASDVRAMARRYDRAFIVDCADTEGCVVGLRKAFDDPWFSEIINDAAGEPTTYA